MCQYLIRQSDSQTACVSVLARQSALRQPEKLCPRSGREPDNQTNYVSDNQMIKWSGSQYIKLSDSQTVSVPELDRQLDDQTTRKIMFHVLSDSQTDRQFVLQSRYWLPHYAYLTRRTSHFLYAYHIRRSPYARFVRTTSFLYRYHPLSVILVPHMIPSLLRIW